MTDGVKMSSGHLTDENYLVIWLNCHNDESTQIEQIVHNALLYTDPDTCIDFLTDIVDEKVFLILSVDFDSQLISLIHDVPQLHSIYVCTDDSIGHKSWMSFSEKVRCVSHSIDTICKSLARDIVICNNEFAVPISVIRSNQCTSRNLNELPPSFMYSQILAEVLSDIGDHPTAKEDLIHYWYQQYSDNESQLSKVNEFDRTYCPALAIRWYSREPFVYSILNRTLRTLDIDVFILMGFFLRDLNEQIKQVYEKQSKDQIPSIVYRGQRMNKDEFAKLRRCLNGLLSFNNFVSTSANPEVASMYLPNPAKDLTIIAVRFKIELDPKIRSAPYILLSKDQTNFPDEAEILFSMHSIFRVIQVEEIEKDLFEVTLRPTTNHDEDLTKLTDYIRTEIQGHTGWHRLALLLNKIGSYDKAAEIHQKLLKQTSPWDRFSHAFHLNEIGIANHHGGKLQEALHFYRARLQIEEETLPANHPNLAVTYHNIASINSNMGNYAKALKFYEMALKIEQIHLPVDSPDLAMTYNSMGVAYKNAGNYNEAIRMYQTALKIGENSLPPIHPDLVLFCNNIAAMYYELQDYPNALRFHQKTHAIEKRSLLPNHPQLALTNSAIGLLYQKMRNYTQAMTFHQEALNICQISRPPNHPDFITIYNNIASLHDQTHEYSDALHFYNQALQIARSSPDSYQLEIALMYNNIGAVYHRLDDYQHALDSYEKSRVIYESFYSQQDHLDLVKLYNNIGMAYLQLKDYKQALCFFERIRPIAQNLLPPDHPLIADCKMKIAHTRNEIICKK